MKKMSPEKKCLLILGIFSIAALIIFLPISISLKYWGVTIGWVLGCVATFLNMLLLFKSGHAVADAAKENKGLSLSFLFYFFRFFISAGFIILCAILDYVCHIEVFKYSIFTCAASVLPSSLILLIFYHDNDDEEKIEISQK